MADIPTREFEFLKSSIPPLGQLTAAGVAAAWLAPHWATALAALALAAILGWLLRRIYHLISDEEAHHGVA